MHEPPEKPAGRPRALIGEPYSALLAPAQPKVLSGDRLLALEAIRLLTRLDRDLMKARAQWNQDWLRRVIHARSKAALRLQRRWSRIDPPAIPLGRLRRRYHANMALYLYEVGR
jgi:hypothetical protein